MMKEDLIALRNKSYKGEPEYKRALQFCTRWKQEYSFVLMIYKVRKLSQRQKANAMAQDNLSAEELQELLSDPRHE